VSGLILRKSSLVRLMLAAAMAMMALVAAAQSVPASATASANLQDLLRKPLTLRGTLGSEQIQMSLQPKPNEDGTKGTYFIFGQSAQILLAGEADQNAMIMEESYNGKDVSGEWDGSFKDGVLSGTWSSLDDAVHKPFMLKLSTP